MEEKGFSSRSFVSLLTLVGFLVMSITGIILYFTPQGRIAYWTDWTFLGLTKVDWGNIHIISCFFFVIVGSFHLTYNWKALTNYLSDRASRTFKLRKELILSLVIGVFLVLGSIYQWQPIKAVLDLNDHLKGLWVVSKEYEPPFGHAEELSLKSFTKKMKIDLDKALTELKNKGVAVESEGDSLAKIAKANGTSPMHLYIMIKKFEKKTEIIKKDFTTPEMVEEQFSGTGIGRKGFEEMCRELGIDQAQAAEKLRQKKITVKKDETLRDIASRYDMSPVDILKIILVKTVK